jgi:hypothetical protein
VDVGNRVLILAIVLASSVAAVERASASTDSVRFEDPSVARGDGSMRGTAAFDCGDLAYDDGTAEDAIFFGGGQAGETDHFLGVRFELADFDLVPNAAALTGFCLSNSLDLTNFGGPWPNEVFVYRDVEGIPQLDDPIRRATVLTGDGSGQVEVTFEDPWPIADPVFWIMIQGDPIHAGEDFNMESDQSSEPANRSWIADRGTQFMVPTQQNFMLRASILRLPGNVQPVPALGGIGLLALVLMLAALAVRALPSRAADRVDSKSA